MIHIDYCNEIKDLKDHEILALTSNNDNIFKCVYNKHKSYCLNFLKSKGANEDEAIDIYQDAAIILHEKSRDAKFVLTSNIQTYLNAVCFNKLRAKRGSKAEKNTVFIEGIEHENATDWYDDEESETREKLDQIVAVISVLKEKGDKCYERLHLFYYQKMSNSEIAKKLGLKDENVVKTAIQRCRGLLKRELGLV
jgi:RNA polymerase sigma factor (sigma-70 family)